jgi:hypothetical protein
MDKNYLEYSPEKKPIGTFYWEVWKGLPFSERMFKREPLEDAIEAWSYSRNGFSIWVPQSAINAYRQNQRTIFIATAERKKKYSGFKTEVKSLRPYEGRLEDAVAEAKDLNHEVAKYCNRKYRRAK